MNDISQILKFKYNWRSYQEKFLANFKEHIHDNHLHVVAPPGSGKTILGLEMMIKVGKPTLVLSPTLTVRNQWQSRLKEFFIQEATFSAYTLDIKAPKYFTFSTYQSLHALNKSFNNTGEDSLISFIKKNKINTLVLDEAHHLKNEWWKCLFKLKEIENLTIIALTATPPYDSSGAELYKYFKLCGPIDEEIAVPDLIKNGDLCPHQDFVYFSKPDEAQIKYIIRYREKIIDFMDTLIANINFQEFLQNLAIYKDTETSLEKIYDHPEFFSSVLIFLNACKIDIDRNKLHFLGFDDVQTTFPTLNYEWLQILLQHVLVTERDFYTKDEILLNTIDKDLRKIGVLENAKVNFIGDANLYRSLANSPSKLESILKILHASYKSINNNLRSVVLTDFITKEFLNYTGENPEELNKLGVVSIFQYLRTKSNLKKHIGVLTGSLVIIHNSILSELKKEIKTEINSKALKVDPDFIIISVSDSSKNTIVAAITSLFQNGFIKILIGTKSLLGEGWDAPAINTLVLASYVGSFVSSNQMRGRAIRVDTKTPHKTGNIWHLACIDPTIADGGKDLEKLTRRFDAFTGVSLEGETYIENGLDRLQLPKYYNNDTDLESINNKMLLLASDRNNLNTRWTTAIENGAVLVHELKIPHIGEKPFKEAKKMASLNVVKFLSIEIISSISLFIPEFFLKNFNTILTGGFLKFFYALVTGILIFFAPRFYKALKVYLLFGNTFKKTKKIANALLSLLFETEQINSPKENIKLITEQHTDGQFVIFIKGGSEHESTLFINLLDEILAPVENPRYLLSNTNWFKRKLGFRNYYVVPDSFGKRKEEAQRFHKHWRKHVDNSKLHFTRSVKGRKLLLKARLAHIMFQFKEVSKKTVTWK